YRYGNTVRQLANDPPAADVQPLRLEVKPAPGQNEVVLRLAARDIVPDGQGGRVVWQRPRFEAAGKPAPLPRDYAQFGPAYEIDYPSVFSESARYLAAVAETATDGRLAAPDLAKKHGLDADFLKRWIDLLALEAPSQDPARIGRPVPAVPLEL